MNGSIDIGGLHLRLGLASEFKKALHNLLAPTGLLNDSRQVPSLGIFAWKVFHHQTGIDEDSTEGVVNFVSNSGGKFSERGHLFGTHQLEMGFLEFLLHLKAWP